MKAKFLLTSLVLVAGCEKPAPHPPGVEDQPSTKVSDSILAKQPTVSDQPDASSEGPTSPGTTTTPPTAFERSDGGAAPTGAKGDLPRPAASGPGDLDDEVEAKAVFKPAPGIKLSGEVELEEVAGGVKIEVEVKNAPPGVKGIHIHQVPDCSDIPGKSMGEHFAPDTKEHGIPGQGAPHHLGDLGNLTIADNGKGELEITVTGANLRPGDPHSLLARAVVIHEKKDEGSQPSGNSGKPIACAIIKPD